MYHIVCSNGMNMSIYILCDALIYVCVGVNVYPFSSQSSFSTCMIYYLITHCIYSNSLQSSHNFVLRHGNALFLSALSPL